jgi:hypothetical protein
VGHPDVHQKDVRAQPFGFRDGLYAVCGLADDVDAARGEDEAEAGADELLVVGDEDARGAAVGDGFGHGRSRGMRARTR